MKKQLFREKSIERISSPEQLNDYIKVSNPGVWMILLSIIVLLIGTCVWGIFGRMETKLAVSVVSKDGETVCYVAEADAADVAAGMTVVIGEKECSVSGITAVPTQITDDFDTYALHVGNLEVGEWVYEVSVDETLPDGVYQAEIITESIAPMSFLLN